MHPYIRTGNLVAICPKDKWVGKINKDCLVLMTIKVNYTRWKFQIMRPKPVGVDWDKYHSTFKYVFSYDWAGTVSRSMSKSELHRLLTALSTDYVVVTEVGNILESVEKLVNKV